MSGKSTPLNVFITLQRGHDLPQKDRVEGKVPVIASTGVTGYHNEAKAKAPGVVIGRSGSIGGGQYITDDFWPLNTTLWVKDFKGHNERFVYYLLKSIDFTAFNVGTGVPTLNRNHLSSILVDDLGRDTEDVIAKILGDLDNKIDLNSQINQTLEQIAQAIFKSWFVDFDPVKAKIAVLKSGGTIEEAERAAMAVISGKDEMALDAFKNENPEAYTALEQTAALFPSSMQDSELGEIPEGWETHTLGSSYKITMGQSPKGTTYNTNNEGMLFFQGRAEFGWRYPKPRLFTTDPKRMASKGDVLMSVRAPVGDLNIALNDCCIGRGLSALKSKFGGITFSYYQLKHLQSQFDRFNAEGTVFGSINQNNIKNIGNIIPEERVLKKFIENVGKIDNKIELLCNEITLLEEMRDALLPKLLSGEIELGNLVEADK